MPHISTGGMPSFVLRRIQALLKFKNEFELFVVEYENISDDFVVQKNEIKSIIKPENFFTLGESKNTLIDIIKKNNIDIIHSDEILEGFGAIISESLINELYDINRNWKIVETCHNVWFNPKSSKRFNPDAYAFCTPYHKEVQFLDMPSYSEVLEFPIENKIPTQELKVLSKINIGFDPNKIHVLNVGLWTPGKNQGEGIELARILEKTNPEIMFHFVGNQAMNFEEYWGPIMKNIPSNVKVWGERSDVGVFMDAADIFMFNSTYECNPLVLREAISHGLKILSRNLPQYMNMFTDYITTIDGDLLSIKYKLLELIKSNRTYIVEDQSDKFSNNYANFYKRVKNLKKIENQNFIPKPVITQNFINGPFLEITGSSTSKFRIEFYDELNNCHYSETLPINHWVRLNRQYYTKWTAKVWENNSLIYENTLSLKDKRVYISFESSSLGDTLAWIPYIKEFKDKHQCDLIVSTFLNELFEDTYPDIKFVKPSTPVHNLYAMYKVGWFYKDDKNDESRNPNDFKSQPLQKTASDILGLTYTEIKPKLKKNNTVKKKKVGIAIHSTCQSKYWNNPTGWQSVVDYLKNLNYEIVLYSNENDGYMGNYYPKGVIKFESGSLENLILDIQTCEFFIGLGSGLSWLAWSLDIPLVLISGFSDEYTEMESNVYRVINKNVCYGCFNKFRLDPGDWNWCPEHKGTERQFECTKQISPEMVIEKINLIKN